MTESEARKILTDYHHLKSEDSEELQCLTDDGGIWMDGGPGPFEEILAIAWWIEHKIIK